MADSNYAYTCLGGGNALEIIADGTGLVTEVDETNNTLTLFVECAIQPQPDLVIDNIRLNGNSIFYQIANIGQAPADASVTETADRRRHGR